MHPLFNPGDRVKDQDYGEGEVISVSDLTGAARRLTPCSKPSSLPSTKPEASNAQGNYRYRLARQEPYLAWRSETSPSWDPANYTHVAIIAAGDDGDSVSLDRAYFLTNHIDHAWWDNEGVTRVGPEARSTSVGDVIFRNGTPYRVAAFGFEEISKAVK